ncbi:protein kinase [Leifsonia sp. YAF41]|uniref:protein kinase domain-containing protein n=1 Tax=Leifsonia sp. YAF41 TaxID=3233086 RepID=UPI003F94DFDC
MTQRPGSAGDDGNANGEGNSLISSRFVLGELLGSGGSASVFEATDVTTGAGIALKVLHPRLSESEATRESFFRQARAASAIRHSNVAGVVALGTDRTQSPPVAWIAFERAAGVSLAEFVDERGPLEIANVVAVAEGMLRGIAAAHAVGVIHRDLSPGNVMVPRESSIAPEAVRVIDFGLADAAGRPVVGVDVVRTVAPPGTDLPGAGSPIPAEPGVLGTVHFLSPEQARGEAVDERADLYQLSAVLFFALTGQPPYPRGSAEETINAHLNAPPPVPSSLRSGVPRELDRLVVKGMLKAQQSRFASAEEMLTAVLSVPAQLPPASAPFRSPQPAPGPARTDDTPPRARTVAPTRILPNPSTAATQVLRAQNSARGHTRTPGGSGGRPRVRPRAGWLVGISGALLVVVVGGFIAASGSTRAPAAIATPSSQPSEAAAVPSTAPEPATVDEVAVPAVMRLALADARSALAGAGLSVGTVGVQDSAEPEGTVIGSSRAAGEWAEAGWSVDLVVASGWNMVPAVVGLTESDASAALSAAGFTVALAAAGSTAGNPGNGRTGSEKVLSAEPAGGTRVQLGRRILIAVADAAIATSAPEPSATPTPTPTAAPTSAPPESPPAARPSP